MNRYTALIAIATVLGACGPAIHEKLAAQYLNNIAKGALTDAKAMQCVTSANVELAQAGQLSAANWSEADSSGFKYQSANVQYAGDTYSLGVWDTATFKNHKVAADQLLTDAGITPTDNNNISDRKMCISVAKLGT